MKEIKPIPVSGARRPTGTPYDLTGDEIWLKDVCKRIDSKSPDRTYKGDDGEEVTIKK